MKIDPNAPAYPVQYSNESDGPTIIPTTGLTIRAEIAARVLASIVLANPTVNRHEAAQWAVNYSNALIAELNREAV